MNLVIGYALLAMLYWLLKSFLNFPRYISVVIIAPLMPFITAYRIRNQRPTLAVALLATYTTLYLSFLLIFALS
jgi:hypothetical protein